MCANSRAPTHAAPWPLQIVVAASRNRATLWDAFSGRFLGVVAVAGCPLDTPHLVDPGAGLPLETGGGRAASSPEGPLPPLGTAGEDMLPGEEARLAQRLNTVALTTSSIAKKCAPRGCLALALLCLVTSISPCRCCAAALYVVVLTDGSLDGVGVGGSICSRSSGGVLCDGPAMKMNGLDVNERDSLPLQLLPYHHELRLSSRESRPS